MATTSFTVVARLALVLVLVVGLTGVTVAQSTEAGATVVIEEGETVGDLQAAGGSVVVRGTVDGDLSGFAGSVVIEESGVVTGDLQASTGSLVIRGTVEGNLEGGGGSVSLTPEGSVGGNLSVAAGDLVLGGTVGGDVSAGVDRVELTSAASVGGTLEYSSDATIVRADGATVDGQVSAVDDLSSDTEFEEAFRGLDTVLSIYGLLATFLVGAVLLFAFPEFADTVTTRVSDEPLVSGGIGLGGLVGIPVVLLLTVITIVGLPVALIGLMAFGLLVFTSSALAEYAVGAWALSYASVDNRWLALVIGVVGVGLLSRLPLVGGPVNLVVFLLGFGAVLRLLSETYRRSRDSGGDGAGLDGSPASD